MFCGKCENNLADCICPDIDERLASLSNSNVVYKKCNKCKLHYARCKCETPEFVSSDPCIPLPEEYK